MLKTFSFSMVGAAMLATVPTLAQAAPAAPIALDRQAPDLVERVVGPVWFDRYGRQCERGSSGVVVCRRPTGEFGYPGYGGGGWDRPRRPRYDEYGYGPKYFTDRYGRQCERASSGRVHCM